MYNGLGMFYTDLTRNPKRKREEEDHVSGKLSKSHQTTTEDETESEQEWGGISDSIGSDLFELELDAQGENEAVDSLASQFMPAVASPLLPATLYVHLSRTPRTAAR